MKPLNQISIKKTNQKMEQDEPEREVWERGIASRVRLCVREQVSEDSRREHEASPS